MPQPKLRTNLAANVRRLRQRDGRMAMRWIAAGMLEAEKQFRKVNGYRDLHVLKRALQCHREVIEQGKHVA